MEKGAVAFEGTSAETGREEVIKRYLAV
jgi:hypothetical protein